MSKYTEIEVLGKAAREFWEVAHHAAGLAWLRPLSRVPGDEEPKVADYGDRKRIRRSVLPGGGCDDRGTRPPNLVPQHGASRRAHLENPLSQDEAELVSALGRAAATALLGG